MRVPVSGLREGMTLAADVIDARGRVIVPSGTSLGARQLKGLRTWGITTVDVRGDEAEAAEAVEPPPLDAQEEERVRSRFLHTDLEHEVTRRLLELSLLRAARRGKGH